MFPNRMTSPTQISYLVRSTSVFKAQVPLRCINDSAARKPVTGFEIKEKESISQLFQLKSLNKQDTWYPTLTKTVWVLSQLHDYVKVSSDQTVA
jgi:hypothetical protein